MKKVVVIVLVIILLFVNTASSLNQNTLEKNNYKNDRKYIAVVVTVVDFENDRNDLNIPVDMMYSPLVSAANWHEENILFIKNENATKENILKGLDWLASQVDENDIALFYYGGHGKRIDDENGDEIDGKDECIATYERQGLILDDQLKLKFDNISAEGLFILIDCCHSGGVVDSNNTMQKLINSKKETGFSNDIKDDFKGCGRVVIASTFEKAVCQEVKGFGTILTLSLKRIISKSKGDANNDGIISAEETFSYLKKIFRRLNFFTITGIFVFLGLAESYFGESVSKAMKLLGLTSLLLWETFSFFAYGGLMVPYYPIIFDEYEGELPFLEI